MDGSNADDIDRAVHEIKINKGIDAVENDKPYDCTDELYGNVNDRNSLGIPVNAYG